MALRPLGPRLRSEAAYRAFTSPQAHGAVIGGMETGEAMGAAAARMRRAATARLAMAQGVAIGAAGVAVTAGPLTLSSMSGRSGWAGLLIAALTIGVGGGALAAGRLMDRRGRRLGLVAGHAGYGAGGLVAAAGAAAGSPGAVVAGAALIGFGEGAAQLGRIVVAELHPPSARARAVGRVLAAGAAGAVGGPVVVALLGAGPAGGPLGAPAAPWLVVPLLAALGAAAAGGVPASRPAAGLPGRPRPPRRPAWARRPARVAIATIAASQVTMVGLMAVAPVAMHRHTGSDVAVALVVSAHLAGMYALAPLAGRAADAAGRRRVLAAGAALCAAGALITAPSGLPALAAVGLPLVGAGWCAAYVASTAVLGDVTPAARRAGAVGGSDLVASGSGAAAAVAAGLLADVAGSAATAVALAAPAPLVLVLVLSLREAAPGRWAGAPAAARHYAPEATPAPRGRKTVAS